ncbi:hypothetical protein BCEP4_2310003 [Burkholderia cepacia]|nr:hypothetical protein BCEP4_2310003 [Burkholderia cepacia]
MIGASVSSPGGQETGSNLTNRGTLGSQRHIVVDVRGIPLAVTVAGANRRDSIAFERTMLFRRYQAWTISRANVRLGCTRTRAMTLFVSSVI